MSAATLHVTRTKAFVDSVSSYRVIVDDEGVAKVRSGRDCTVPLEPGAHRVQLSCLGLRSRPLHVEVDQGERVELVCEPYNPHRPLNVYVRMLTKRDDYMVLRPAISSP